MNVLIFRKRITSSGVRRNSRKQHAAPRKMRDRELIQVHVGGPIIVRCIPTAPAWRAALARAAGAECRMKTHARALFR
jgi:hypothetical protein